MSPTGVTMTPARLTLLAAAGSSALLFAALAFQFIGGLAPCALCIWQRWPHLLAVAAGLIAIRLPQAWVLLCGAAGAATSGSIGMFHVGVEQGWWKGLASCSGALDLRALSPELALEAIMAAAPVACDQVAWQMLDLSMAGWNALLSFALTAIWIYAAHLRQTAAKDMS